MKVLSADLHNEGNQPIATMGSAQMVHRKGIPEKEMGEHVHEGYECIIMLNGKMSLFISGQEHVLVEGNVVAIEPGEEHYVGNKSEDFEAILIFT